MHGEYTPPMEQINPLIENETPAAAGPGGRTC
jgi:hypothetical protein